MKKKKENLFMIFMNINVLRWTGSRFEWAVVITTPQADDEIQARARIVQKLNLVVIILRSAWHSVGLSFVESQLNGTIEIFCFLYEMWFKWRWVKTLHSVLSSCLHIWAHIEPSVDVWSEQRHKVKRKFHFGNLFHHHTLCTHVNFNFCTAHRKL